jgi:hypothetical protein
LRKQRGTRADVRERRREKWRREKTAADVRRQEEMDQTKADERT